MKTIKSLERLQQLHKLILTESTGTPGELAKQMGISERLVYNLIDHLKEFKADIKYSRNRKTYFYKQDFDLKVDISITVMSENEVVKVFAAGHY